MSANQLYPSPEEAARKVKLLIGGMLAGLVGYTAIALFLIRTGFSANPDLAPLFGGLILAMAAGLAVASAVVPKLYAAKTAKHDSATSDQQRVQAYVGMKLFNVATSEGTGLFGTTALLITGNIYFLAVPVVAAWIMFRQFPRPGEIAALSHAIGPGSSTHATAIEP